MPKKPLQHTPGPWDFDTDGEVLFIVAGKRTIARIEADEDELDARLITACPDLAEACEAAWLNLTSPYGRNDEQTKRILLAALKKAGLK